MTVAANPAQNALLKMMVPRQVVGALIGKQGSNLKAGSTEAWRAGWSRWFFVAISVFCNCATEDNFGQLFFNGCATFGTNGEAEGATMALA